MICAFLIHVDAPADGKARHHIEVCANVVPGANWVRDGLGAIRQRVNNILDYADAHGLQYSVDRTWKDLDSAARLRTPSRLCETCKAARKARRGEDALVDTLRRSIERASQRTLRFRR